MGRPRKIRDVPGNYDIKVADMTNQIYPEATPQQEDGTVADSGDISVEDARSVGAISAESAKNNKETAKRSQMKRAGEKRVPWNEENILHLFHAVKDTWPLQGITIYMRRTEPMPPEDFRPFSASLFRTGQELYDYIAKHIHRNNPAAQYEARFKDTNGMDRAKGFIRMPDPSPDMQQQGAYDPMQAPPFPPPMPNAFSYGAPYGAPQNPYPSPYPQYPSQHGYPAPFGVGAPPQIAYPQPYQGVPGPGMSPQFQQTPYAYPQEAPQSVSPPASPSPAPAPAAVAAPVPSPSPVMDQTTMSPHFGVAGMPYGGFQFQQPPAPPPQPAENPAMMGHIASTYQEVVRMQQMMHQNQLQLERALGTIEEMKRSALNSPPPWQQQQQYGQPQYVQQTGPTQNYQAQNPGMPPQQQGLPAGAPMPPGYPGAPAMPGNGQVQQYQGQPPQYGGQQPYYGQQLYPGQPYPPQYGPPQPPVDPMVQAQTQINQSMGMIASLTKSMEQIKHMFNPQAGGPEYDDPEPIEGVPTPAAAVPPPFNVMSLGTKGMIAHNNDGSLNLWGTAIGNMPTIMEGVKSLGEVFGKAQQAEQARSQTAQAQTQAYEAAIRAHSMGLTQQQVQSQQVHVPPPPVQRQELPQYAPQQPQFFQAPVQVSPQDPVAEPVQFVTPKASVSCLPSMDVIMSTMEPTGSSPSP